MKLHVTGNFKMVNGIRSVWIIALISALNATGVAGKRVYCLPSSKYRTLDGTCNNPLNSSVGSTGNTLLVPTCLMPPNLTSILPSARKVSNELLHTWWSKRSNRMTDLFTFFAQLIDHDLIRFSMPGDNEESFPIPVTEHDSQFKGPDIPFRRLKTVKTPHGPSPINQLSAFIDASLVYGTNEQELQDIRNGTDGCKLKTAHENMLPPLPLAVDGKFLAGDFRVNENILLAAFHTLWMREHNTLCAELTTDFPEWSREKTFQEARKILGAELQKVTYEEWLPAMLGPIALPNYESYNSSVDPRPSMIFAGAAFRVGHVLVNDAVLLRHKNGTQNYLGIEKTLFTTDQLLNLGLDPIIRGAIWNKAKTVDLEVVHALRNLLVTQRGGRHLDLASINIQRARDLRIPLYNEARSHLGLKKYETFREITRDKRIVKLLKEVYGTVDMIDAWVGGLAEDKERNSGMGELFTVSWIDAFRRIRDGDRFFYQQPGLFEKEIISKNRMLALVVNERDKTVMKNVILRNTGLTQGEVPDNPFVPHVS